MTRIDKVMKILSELYEFNRQIQRYKFTVPEEKIARDEPEVYRKKTVINKNRIKR